MSPDERAEWEAIIPGLSDIEDAGPRRNGCYLTAIFGALALFWAIVVVWAVVVR